MNTSQRETVIVGGGQAGLALSYYLKQGGREHVVILFILSSGARLAAVGCALGLLGAVAASRLLRSFLFEVSPFDPGVLALSAITMLLLALAASALPARRASSTDPILALRGE